jgi:hypothetical protein
MERRLRSRGGLRRVSGSRFVISCAWTRSSAGDEGHVASCMLLTAVKASRTAEETLHAEQLSNDRVKGTRKCPSQLDGIKYGGTGGNVCQSAFAWVIKPAEKPEVFYQHQHNRYGHDPRKGGVTNITSCTSVDKSQSSR